MFLYSCAWAQSADWKTCTLKASKVVTYQNGSKTNETKSNISITIDKPNYTIRVGNQMFYVEGKEYGHEIEMYTVEQGEKRDKRQ